MFFNKQITQLVISSPSSSCRSLPRLRKGRWIPPAARIALSPASTKFVSHPNTTRRASLPKRISRIKTWQLDGCQKRFTRAHCLLGVRPSSVNALRWLRGSVTKCRHGQIASTFPFLFLCTSNANRRPQAKVRSPFMDKYFVYASMLGTHTFFLVFLLMFFFFGRDDLERG